jgi:hypothetical protein
LTRPHDQIEHLCIVAEFEAFEKHADQQAFAKHHHVRHRPAVANRRIDDLQDDLLGEPIVPLGGCYVFEI